MLVEVFPHCDAVSERAAELVSDQIRRCPSGVIGFATGSTPIGLYRRLIRDHRAGLKMSGITTFNLDEYVGLEPDHPQSYRTFMQEHLFDHVDVDPDRVHIPDGMADDVDGFCREYERRIEEAGGIDLQILGIGANGHLAFNEPGSSLGSRTRSTVLTKKTMQDNARFFERYEQVPRRAITMGLATIMDARKLLILACGKGKALAVQAMLEGPVTATCPASIVQHHPFVHVLLDEASSSGLTYWHHDGIAEPRT